jgi:hypothetical protein
MSLNRDRPRAITTYRDEDRCRVLRRAQSRVLNALQETSFSDLDLRIKSLPTVCSSNRDIIDETETIRLVFSTVMARRPNGDESSPRGFGRASNRRFHDSVNCFAHCAETTLDRVQRCRTHYVSVQNEMLRATELKDLELTVQVALWESIRNFRLAV